MSKSFKLGAFLVILSAAFWGASGVFGQYLFQVAMIPPMYITVARLICSGFCFLAISIAKGDKDKFISVFKCKKDLLYIMAYGIVGIMNVQLTYFYAINYSNAATATIIQYLSPAITMVYLSIRWKSLPEKTDFVAVIFALVGIFLISTHGDLNSLSISALALSWGIASAFAMAINTVMPVNHVRKYGSPVVMAWGMLIGGSVLGIYAQPWNMEVTWTLHAALVFCGVVLIGTVAAFYCFFEGTKIIGPGKASLIVSFEPLMATVFTAIGMGISFVAVDYVGLLCITIMLVLLAIGGDSKK